MPTWLQRCHCRASLLAVTPCLPRPVNKGEVESQDDDASAVKPSPDGTQRFCSPQRSARAERRLRSQKVLGFLVGCLVLNLRILIQIYLF